MPNQLGVTRLAKLKYVVFDLETTGFSPYKDNIIQIGAIKIDGKRIISEESFNCFVNPERHIPSHISEFTNIFDETVRASPTISVVLREFFSYAGDRIFVAHNGIRFDIRFLEEHSKKCGFPQCNFLCVDTLWLSKRIFPDKGLKHNLDAIMARLNVPVGELHRHDALADVICTARCFIKMMEIMESKGNDHLMLIA